MNPVEEQKRIRAIEHKNGLQQRKREKEIAHKDELEQKRIYKKAMKDIEKMRLAEQNREAE
jgi:hypothetical protein